MVVVVVVAIWGFPRSWGSCHAYFVAIWGIFCGDQRFDDPLDAGATVVAAFSRAFPRFVVFCLVWAFPVKVCHHVPHPPKMIWGPGECP